MVHRNHRDPFFSLFFTLTVPIRSPAANLRRRADLSCLTTEPNLIFSRAVALIVTRTSHVAHSATLSLCDEFIVAANGDVLPFVESGGTPNSRSRGLLYAFRSPIQIRCE